MIFRYYCLPVFIYFEENTIFLIQKYAFIFNKELFMLSVGFGQLQNDIKGGRMCTMLIGLAEKHLSRGRIISFIWPPV